jgi:hypothetical protein
MAAIDEGHVSKESLTGGAVRSNFSSMSARLIFAASPMCMGMCPHVREEVRGG